MTADMSIVSQAHIKSLIDQQQLEIGLTLVRSNFYRYKTWYKITKRELVDNDGQLEQTPSVMDDALAQDYQRTQELSSQLEALFDKHMDALRDVEQACLAHEDIALAAGAHKAAGDLNAVSEYSKKHPPTQQQIDTAYQNILTATHTHPQNTRQSEKGSKI